MLNSYDAQDFEAKDFNVETNNDKQELEAMDDNEETNNDNQELEATDENEESCEEVQIKIGKFNYYFTKKLAIFLAASSFFLNIFLWLVMGHIGKTIGSLRCDNHEGNVCDSF